MSSSTKMPRRVCYRAYCSETLAPGNEIIGFMLPVYTLDLRTRIATYVHYSPRSIIAWLTPSLMLSLTRQYSRDLIANRTSITAPLLRDVIRLLVGNRNLVLSQKRPRVLTMVSSLNSSQIPLTTSGSLTVSV